MEMHKGEGGRVLDLMIPRVWKRKGCWYMNLVQTRAWFGE